ncbi:DUF4260 domain-containing protein [Celerinatantimonas sp. YJH-8]|uniref:DUF4260 domain-containing protein n=1 Tax=Celerinatantimonas sp. YJH-8 TaxID=3228714 RepID=UPI0038BEDEE2
MGYVVGHVKWTLRVESLLIVLLALYFYHTGGYSWSVFTLFFLAPDLSFLGYLAGPKIGAVLYNGAHSLIGALCGLGLGELFNSKVCLMAGLIWMAHIGFDRALGYGLKYGSGFSNTHLGKIGKASD